MRLLTSTACRHPIGGYSEVSGAEASLVPGGRRAPPLPFDLGNRTGRVTSDDLGAVRMLHRPAQGCTLREPGGTQGEQYTLAIFANVC